MRQLRRWKRLWPRSLTRLHMKTSMGHSRSCWNNTTSALLLKEISSKGTRVFMCVLSIKVPIRKTSITALEILFFVIPYSWRRVFFQTNSCKASSIVWALYCFFMIASRIGNYLLLMKKLFHRHRGDAANGLASDIVVNGFELQGWISLFYQLWIK